MNNYDRQLLEARNAYAYPRAYLEKLYGGVYLSIGVERPEPATPENIAQMSQDAWEAKHRNLLRSSVFDDVVLGLASIVFWGFYSGSRGRVYSPRALTRARWLRDGRPPGKRPLNRDVVLGGVQEAVRCLDAGDLTGALVAIKDIPEFGQLSFASKLLVAMAPERAAVYDKVVADTLGAAGPLAAAYWVSPNQGGISRPKAETYAKWCELCKRRATQMNQYGVEISGWSSVGVGKREWRPVDVERAFFQSRCVAHLLSSKV